MPEVESKTSLSEASLIDVDAPSVQTVPSDFPYQEIRTETQASQHEREAEDRGVAHRTTSNRSQGGGSPSKRRATADNNPVLLGNAVVVAALASVLGWNGWRWWQNGARGGASFVGGVIAAVGVFGVGDYYFARWATAKYADKK